MLKKEIEWWSLLSALTIYCSCLQRLIVPLKFVSTQRDNYLLKGLFAVYEAIEETI